ncbi:hypothetical protein DITRI_Ditri03aG0092500 [Diplodiscus trichospermus]
MSKVDESAVSRYPKRYSFAERNSSTSNNNSQGAPAASPKASKSAKSAKSPISSDHHKHKNKKRKLMGWLLGFLARAVAGSISGFIFSVMFKLVLATITERKYNGSSIFSSLIKKADDLAFLEKENGLSSLEIIGKGGCGVEINIDLD